MSSSIVWSCEREIEVPARRVDADQIHQLVEQHHVAATLRHALRLAALGEVHHLVDRHLDTIGIEAERCGGCPQTSDVSVVIGAEHVQGLVEPAIELVDEVGESDAK